MPDGFLFRFVLQQLPQGRFPLPVLRFQEFFHGFQEVGEVCFAVRQLLDSLPAHRAEVARQQVGACYFRPFFARCFLLVVCFLGGIPLGVLPLEVLLQCPAFRFDGFLPFFFLME